MSLIRRRALNLSLVLVLSVAGPLAAQQHEPAALWSDFNHYVRIARPDLANSAGAELLSRISEEDLLRVVEEGDYPDYERTLLRASRIETVRKTAQRLGDKIQSARIKRSRDPERIRADIQLLAEGERANWNATQRLKAAGQYAAPHLLASLLDEHQHEHQPWVLAAMTAIGRDLVYPLSVALSNLEPVPMGQIARVLVEIGYPTALPYLKEVVEDPTTDPSARRIVTAVYNRLADSAGVSKQAAAGDLFLALGGDYLAASDDHPPLPGYDSATDSGVVWEYGPDTGLVPIPVPGRIYADVLAMRAAQQALKLNPHLDEALSLWLLTNLRRGNNLPEGVRDLSYASSRHLPEFYLHMAGPLRQHDVLDWALNHGDVPLALDAIDALSATAGTNALLNREGTIQPLIRGLSYPDRRVRFAAAFALTNARPQSDFPGSHRVVPVMAEAVRQSDARYALVLASDQPNLNRLMASIRDLGYIAYGGLSIEQVADQVNLGPGVDLIVCQQSVDQVQALHRQTQGHYMLAAVPILAVVSPGDQVELHRRMHDHLRVQSVVPSADLQAMRNAVDRASRTYTGQPIGTPEATRIATEALSLLQKVAVNANKVFDVTGAQPALVLALNDQRLAIPEKAAAVLAEINNPQAQRAIADAALDLTRPMDVRVALLDSLSDSATAFGNHLDAVQLNGVLELTKNSRDRLALAAARAHGSLVLPTSNAVQLITQQP